MYDGLDSAAISEGFYTEQYDDMSLLSAMQTIYIYILPTLSCKLHTKKPQTGLKAILGPHIDQPMVHTDHLLNELIFKLVRKV